MLDSGLKGEKKKEDNFTGSGSAVWWRQASGDNPMSYRKGKMRRGKIEVKLRLENI